MAKTDSKTVVPKFIPDPTQTSKRVYSNFANVKATGVDFTISFADVPPPTKEQVEKAKKGEDIRVPLQCEIVVPNDLVPALINALRDQYDKYQERLKKSKDNKAVGTNKHSDKN